jgi:hypothetical protein
VETFNPYSLLSAEQQTGKPMRRHGNWADCDKTKSGEGELRLMGYSMRTKDFRYTAWFHYNSALCLPLLDVALYAEELYDHRNETPEEFGHLEMVNLAKKSGAEPVARAYRERLIAFIKSSMVFRGCFKG